MFGSNGYNLSDIAAVTRESDDTTTAGKTTGGLSYYSYSLLAVAGAVLMDAMEILPLSKM